LRVNGKVAAGTGVGLGVAAGVAEAGGRAEAVALDGIATGVAVPAPVHAPRISAAVAPRTIRRPDRERSGRREPGTRNPSPEGRGVKDGRTRFAYPFSRRFEQDLRVGDRTRAVVTGSGTRDAATTVAGLCRDLTGFATERSGVMKLTARLYHATPFPRVG
jgi:hypothetical protein